MEKLKIKLINLAIIGTTSIAGFAQESAVATGGDASSSDGSVSYSVGQVLVERTSDGTYNVTPGVQQAYEVSEVVGLHENVISNLELNAYPNPTTDGVTIGIPNFGNEALSFSLIDATGRQIQKGQITSANTSVEMSNLEPATYFIKVSELSQPVKTFKIIKR